mmetsp:Transcript_18218/g.50249  ORF Transcript_18218/g.50249 Transcript_18218/m.50249 type:complete len:174 (+) Transcript_18218:53-574(+)
MTTSSTPVASRRRAVSSRPRNVLNAHQAAAIFQIGLMHKDQKRLAGFESVVSISRAFGVSPKTIRDIWNNRTWNHATVKGRHESKRVDTAFEFSENSSNDEEQSSSPCSAEWWPSPSLAATTAAECIFLPKAAVTARNIDWVLGEWDQGRSELKCLPDPFSNLDHSVAFAFAA